MRSEGKISFLAAVLMSINIMVGAGILYAVGPMTASAGSISFLGWPLIGMMLFPIIWTIAKAAQLFPGEGGFYHYCSSGLNPLAGFIAHWGYLLGFLGMAASIASVLRTGLVHHLGLDFIQAYPLMFNLVLVSIYTFINLIALENISKIQSLATLVKIAPIVIVILLTAFYFHPHLVFNLGDLVHTRTTVSTVIFAFWGFEACCSIGGLLKEGPKKVTSVILIGFFATMALYFLFHMGLLYIMGPDNLAAHGATAFPKFLGLSPLMQSILQACIVGAVLFSWLNSILGISLGNITNIHFLAKKNMIFGSGLLSKVNSKHRPIYAAIVHGVVLLGMITFITDIGILVALTNLGVIIAFVLTLSAVFATHLRQKNYPQLGITLLAFLCCFVLMYYSWIQIPSFYYAIPLIAGLIVGIALFQIQKYKISSKSL